MATPNKTIMAKADMEVADLIADGGYLQPEQARQFMVDLIKESVMLKLVTVKGMKSHTMLIDNVGLNGRVLRPGTSGRALAAGDRTKPVTDQVELQTHLMKGEIRLPDEVLEDNIEGGTFKTTVQAMIAEQTALDMDELLVNGDTSSLDPFLALLDGMLVSATSHVVSAGVNPLAKSHLKSAIKAMPSVANRNRAAQRFMTSEDGELDYRDYLADRATVLGDKFLMDEAPVRYAARPILPVPVFPDNLGIGTNCTNVLLTDPKNAYWGVWRKIRLETDRDIVSGEWVLVVTVRAGFEWKKEDYVVKITNVLTN